MADHATHRNVEVSDGDRVVASAQVDTSPDTSDTARASLHAESGHLPAGSRASLVDAVLDLPNFKAVLTWKRPFRSVTRSPCNGSENAPTT
jgi:hypothetical protein